MNMIDLDVKFLYFTALLTRKEAYSSFNFISNISLQYPIPILWYPNKVILTVPYGM